MKKIVLIFGLISGAISSVMMVATVPFADKIGHWLYRRLHHHRALIPVGILRHPLVPRQRWQRPHHLRQSIHRRDLHHCDFVLCSTS